MTPPNNISEQDLEQMEAYLSGAMTEQEQSAFSTRLQTEPALQEAQLLITGIREVSLLEKMDLFHNNATGKVRSIAPNRFRNWWMVAAASVIVIVVSAMLLWKNDENQYMAAYFEPDPGLITTMGATDNYAFDRAMVDYKTGKYEQAIQGWRPLIAANSGNDTLHYFSGVSFLALNQSDSATHHLLQVFNNQQSAFYSDAAWYLALSSLNKGNKADARSFLQKTNHPRKDELLLRIK